ncbi:hypothetical protein ES703_05042 [subsurface metagenome]
MCSRALILAAIALVIFAYSVQTPFVHAWAGLTHRFIVNDAKDVFSDNSFLSIHYSTIYTYCTKPDEWKGSDPYEEYRHWYHVDEPEGENEYYRGGLPNNLSILEKGVLPWAVEDNFVMLVQSLESEDWEHAAQLMGAIGHYTGDATNPLHATSDYNPGYNHLDYEYEVNDHLYEISIPDYVPQELENIFESTMVVLEESYGFTGYTEDKLSYWLDQDVLWNDTIYHITENRLRSATQFTANLWYTAMIHAGLTIQAPTLLEPGNGAIISDNTPTFEWSSTVTGYQLEYATDNTFTTNVTIAKDLMTTSYTPATPLADGTWYWRVRSGDNTTSVGLWSDTWQFIVEPLTGTAVFSLVNLYTVNVEKILDLNQGSKLVVKFYTYTDAFENENVIETFTTPPTWHVEEDEDARHPEGVGVKKVRLDLTTDDTEDVITTIASFTVRKVDLEVRFMEIPMYWAAAPPEGKVELEIEFMEIPMYWAAAPS